MFRQSRPIHVLVMLVSAVAFVLVCLRPMPWWGYVTAALVMGAVLCADIAVVGLYRWYWQCVAERAGLPHQCASTLAEKTRPRRGDDIAALCLRGRAAPVSGADDILTLAMSVTDDHEEHHEVIRRFSYADSAEKALQRSFWEALAGSDYSYDEAIELAWEHGYAVATEAVRSNLPAEYAANLV